jgi:hypothetical protein
VRAICDTSCDIGLDWSKLDTIVKVILTVHVQHAEQYYKNICSQVKLVCLFCFVFCVIIHITGQCRFVIT